MLWMTLRKFESGDPAARCAAARALGESGKPKAVEALLHACDDPDPDVRLATAKALAVFVLTLQKRQKAAELGRGSRLSPGEVGTMQNAVAAIQRMAAEDQEKKPGAAEARKAAPTGERRREIRRGGFGEPYCSESCYDEAGRAMATARLTGAAGPCEYCKSLAGPRDVMLVKRGRLVFICRSCASRVKAEIEALSVCYLCEAPLAG